MSSGDNSGCCYLCNECPNSYSTLEDLETHLRQHLMRKIQGAVNGQSPMVTEDIKPKDTTMRDEEVDALDSPSSSEHSPSALDPNDMKMEMDMDMDESSEMLDLKPGYNCRFCPTQFDEQSQLNIHYTHTHRDKPQYECEVCRIVFGVKRELATHMRIHSGEQPHKCTQCGKEFGTRQLLKKHWMWHTGERSHVCPHCNKAFFQKGHLTQHLMIHAGGRPHQCKLCQKTFIFKFDLNRHMKIHAERGFGCQQCGKAFSKQNLLDEHVMLKCKGARSSVVPTRTSTPIQPVTPLLPSRRQSTPSMFPVAPKPILPFTADDINKLTQTLLLQQQQRALSMISNQQNHLSHQSHQSIQQHHFEQPIPHVSCFLCQQKFPNQHCLALHVGMFHMGGNGLMANLPQMTPKPMEEQHKLPTHLSVFTPVKPIKTENDDVRNASEGEGDNSATNSSCASSPQKPSPLIRMDQSSADISHVSPSISTTYTNGSESPEPSENKCCNDCSRNRSRAIELESELERNKDELEKAKEALKQVSSIAQQLGSCVPFDPQFFLNTKTVFTQIQSVLRNVECQ